LYYHFHAYALAYLISFFSKIKNFKIGSLLHIDDYWRPNERVKFEKILNISAKENINVDKLCAEIRNILDNIDDKHRSFSQSQSDDDETRRNASLKQEQTLKNLI
jgi:GTPase Era involved in 16S rRNA processing